MDPHEALSKLASDLTDRVAFLEQENAQLRDRVTAGETAHKPVQTPVVKTASLEEIDKACQALVRVGALAPDQIELSKKAFQDDPDAAFRTICGILDAQAQTKSASDASHLDLRGGELVTGAIRAQQSVQEDCIERMCSILGCIF